MTQQHPITPPQELVEQWLSEYNGEISDVDHALAIRAARWGADMELEACCEWLETYVQRWAEWSASFRADRRPKSPSLKEQALKILNLGHEGWGLADCDWHTIRRALERLPDD